MGASDEFVPEVAVIEEVIKCSVLPIVWRCEDEMGESLRATLDVYCSGVKVLSILVDGSLTPSDNGGGGAMRLLFRRTHAPNRHRFKVEAIYPNLEACATGFSGFEVDGDVKLEEPGIQVRTKSEIFRHNVWEWQGW